MPGSTKDAIFTPGYGGTYNIIERRGNLTDAAQTGGGMQACISIPVPPSPPVANPGGPYTGSIGNQVTFNGNGSSDPNGDPLTYSWDFGDASPLGTGATPSHTYSAEGIYTVTLTVNDTTFDSAPVNTTANRSVNPYLIFKRLKYVLARDKLLLRVTTKDKTKKLTMSAAMDGDGDGTYETDLGALVKVRRGVYRRSFKKFSITYGFPPTAVSRVKVTSSMGGTGDEAVVIQ
jgi:hypothetical protein